MAKEIERKYLVKGCGYRDMSIGQYRISQGYLSVDPKCTVRVRIKGEKAYLTVKGITLGCERDEWEYEIPMVDACSMLERMCQGTLVEKTRYIVPATDGLVWEIDEFSGNNTGLVVAEIELPSSDYPLPPLPDFIGEEVTGDSRYYNSNLVSRS